MFGLISAGVSLAGIGLNVAQTIKSSRDAKKFASEADSRINQYSQGRMTDYMAGLQAPDIMSMASDNIRANTAEGLNVLQGQDAGSAIGGAANLVQAGNRASIEAAQEQAMLNQQTQEKRLASKQGIEEEAFGRQKEAEAFRAGNAVSQQNQAMAARDSAMAGIASGLSAGLGSVSSMFDPATGMYLGKKKKSSNTNTNKPVMGLGGQQLGADQSQIDYNTVFGQQQAPASPWG